MDLRRKEMRMKKIIIVGLLIIIVLLGAFSLILGGLFSAEQPLSIKMFDSLQEFSKLDKYAIQEYTSESRSDLEELIVTDQYSCVASYNNITYTVSAYVFPDASSSQVYFERVTGRTSQEEWNYSCSGNVVFKTRYVVYYKNKAYIVEGKDQKSCVEFINWLSADFTYDLMSDGR